MPRTKWARGDVLDIGVPGVKTTYEDSSGQKLRLQLEGGISMFTEDPHDLNLYIVDGVQLHRTKKIPQRGTEESRAFCASLVWTGGTVSIQLLGPRTLIVYTDTISKTRNAATCALLAIRMLEKARSLDLNP